MLYHLDVCQRDNFNTCFSRVTRPQLTNNMSLFSANGTNSSILRRGDFVTSYLTLSEPVPMFSTMLSKFYVSTLFLLHCKKRFSFEKVYHKCEQICLHLLEEKESFIICVANSYVCVKRIMSCNCLLSSSHFSASHVRVFRSVNRYSRCWKSLNVADRQVEFSFLWDIHVRIDIKIDISISINSIAAFHTQRPGNYSICLLGQ